MSDTEALWEFLEEKDHNDWHSWGVLGDSLLDDGEFHLSHAVAWMVRNRNRPYKAGHDNWHWYDIAFQGAQMIDPESDIPHAVFELLDGRQEFEDRIKHAALGDAVGALSKALAACGLLYPEGVSSP